MAIARPARQTVRIKRRMLGILSGAKKGTENLM